MTSEHDADALRADLNEALDAVYPGGYQIDSDHPDAITGEDGRRWAYSSLGVAAQAEIMRLLAKHGRLRIISEHGRRAVLAVPAANTATTAPAPVPSENQEGIEYVRTRIPDADRR